MGRIVSLLFNPPPMPEIALPFPAHLIPQIKVTIAKALETVYYRGVYDGLIGGVLLTLLLVPTIKSRIAKGASNAIEHL